MGIITSDNILALYLVYKSCNMFVDFKKEKPDNVQGEQNVWHFLLIFML